MNRKLFHLTLIILFLSCFIKCSPASVETAQEKIITYGQREYNFRAKNDALGIVKINTSLNELYFEDNSVIQYLNERVVNNCTEFYDMSNRHFMTTCIDMGEVPGSKQYVTYFEYGPSKD